jgi:hypothetical protein
MEQQELQDLLQQSGYRPGRSSQTTLRWPISRRTEEGEIIINCTPDNCQISNLGGRPINPERSREVILDEVFEEHAEAWQRLAEL